MKLTKSIEDHILAVEKEGGEKSNPQFVEVLKALVSVCDRHKSQGVRDAANGLTQTTKEAFIEVCKRELVDLEDKDIPIVELMYQCYLDGYNAGRVAV